VRTLWATVLALVLAGVPAQGAAATPEHQANTSVVGGQPTSIAEFPSLAAIGIEGEESEEGPGPSCSGTVIAPRVVLTAGHCIENLVSLIGWRPSDYRVLTGVADIHDPPPANTFKVSAVVSYPGFNPHTFVGDAGLLILARPTRVPPIALASPAAPAVPVPGAPLRLAAWGLTDLSEPAPSVLQTGEMSTRSHRHCARRAKAFDLFYSPSQQLCGGDLPSEEVATCFGDSGGPAITLRPDGTQVEVGIVSNGGPFCDPNEPNIFTRVEAIAEWAQGWIAAVETGAPPPTGPKAELPRMTMEQARVVDLFTLVEVLGDRYAEGSGHDTRCRRQSEVAVRCDDAWTLGRNSFTSALTSRWAIRRNQVVLDGSYVVRRVRRACLGRRHPGTCPVHTVRG
jgi:secreted trypsin-like serine protease